MTEELTLARRVANAILYEGYLLYPYRPSALKNHRRFDFGVLYPADNRLDEASAFRVEAPAQCERDDELQVIVRFLHLVSDDQQPGVQQGREREFLLHADVGGIADLPITCPFRFPDGAVSSEPGTQEAVQGEVTISARALGFGGLPIQRGRRQSHRRRGLAEGRVPAAFNDLRARHPCAG